MNNICVFEKVAPCCTVLFVVELAERFIRFKRVIVTEVVATVPLTIVVESGNVESPTVWVWLVETINYCGDQILYWHGSSYDANCIQLFFLFLYFLIFWALNILELYSILNPEPCPESSDIRLIVINGPLDMTDWLVVSAFPVSSLRRSPDTESPS